MLLRTCLFFAILSQALAGCGDDDSSQDAGRRDAGRGGSGADAATAVDGGSHKDGGNGGDGGSARMRAVTIRFVGRVGATAFECGHEYPAQGSTAATITPVDFRFYVQDLALVTADGVEVPVKIDAGTPWQADGVALLDFENATGACAGAGTPETNTQITGQVPVGSYVGVRFANGVPEALNHGDPTTLPSVLQVGGLQWSWLSGFRFVKAEVVQVLDDDADAGTVPGYGMAHPGAAACQGNPGAGTIQCANPNRNAVRLDHFDPDTNVITADIGAIFSGSDLTEVTQCHGFGGPCAPMFERLGIDPATGKPLPTQQTYHVE